MRDGRVLQIAVTVWLLVVGVGSRVLAQGTPANDMPSSDTSVRSPGAPAAEQIEPPPPPTKEVMRPTRHGFRLTPGMARWGARQWIREEMKGLDLSASQADALADRVARQAMRFAHQHSRDGRELLEMWLEAQFAQQAGRFTPERKKVFGRRLAEMVPALREFFKDISADARPLLTDAQWEKWKEDLADELRDLYRLEADARRWAEGGAEEDEKIEDLGEKKGAKRDTSSGQGERKKIRPIDRARRRARRDVEWLIEDDCGRFLENAARFFKFDERQTARGRRLLADYRAKKKAIQTAQWRTALMRNRVKFYLRWFDPIEHIGPWEHLLETEYQALLQPWRDLQSEFKSAVIALATPEQRKAALAEVRERALEHGLTQAEVDALLAGCFQP